MGKVVLGVLAGSSLPLSFLGSQLGVSICPWLLFHICPSLTLIQYTHGHKTQACSTINVLITDSVKLTETFKSRTSLFQFMVVHSIISKCQTRFIIILYLISAVWIRQSEFIYCLLSNLKQATHIIFWNMLYPSNTPSFHPAKLTKWWSSLAACQEANTGKLSWNYFLRCEFIV